jgi:hypothetical protein
MKAASSLLVRHNHKDQKITKGGNRQRWLVKLSAAFALCCGVMVAAPAHAQCVPINSAAPPTGDAALFAIEGKITGYNVAARTITANGVTFTVPTTLGINTNDPALPPNNTFATMTAAAAEATRTIVGGTVIASGDITNTVTAAGNCISFTATSVFVEMAENVLLGVLHDINTAAQTFKVNGQVVKMNTDGRFPSALLDLNGKPTTVAALVGFEGTAVSVEGWVENGVFQAILAETSAVTRTGTTDAVAITKAQLRAGPELRVDGQVIANSNGVLATLVEVFVGPETNGKCNGTRLGQATVAADTTFSFRLRRTSFPSLSSVCVKTSLGGVADHDVTNK